MRYLILCLLVSCLFAQRTRRPTQAVRATFATHARRADSLLVAGNYNTLAYWLTSYLISTGDTFGFLYGDSVYLTKVKTGAFRLTTGATNGWYLKSDAQGNGSWAYVSGGSGGPMPGDEIMDSLNNKPRTFKRPVTLDSTAKGKICRAESLGTQPGSYYLSRSNHSGTQTKSTISDFAHGSSSHSGTIGTISQITALLDSLLAKLPKYAQADSARDADSLGHSAPSYYLNRENHSGSQGRSTISDFWSASFWSSIPDKPSAFPPDAHAHPWGDLTGGGDTVKTKTDTTRFKRDSANVRTALKDSINSVRGDIRDSATKVWNDSSQRLEDSCGVKVAVSRFTADSIRLNDSCAVKIAVARFTADSVRLNDSCAAKQSTSQKGQANGYAGLGSPAYVPTAQLGSGSATSATYLRGDQTWATPAGGGVVDRNYIIDSLNAAIDTITSQWWFQTEARGSIDNAESLGHYSTARFTDTTRHKADSARTKAHLDSFPLADTRLQKSTDNAGVTLALHDLLTGTPTTNYVPKWNGTNWAWAEDATGGGSGTALDAPDRYKVEWWIQPNSGLTTIAQVGFATVPTARGTASALRDSHGYYLNYASTAVIDSQAGWRSNVYTETSPWENPVFTAVIKTGPAAADTAAVRIWVGLARSTMRNSNDPVSFVAAFRFVPGTAGGWQLYTNDSVTTGTATATNVIIRENRQYQMKVAVFSTNGATDSVVGFINGVRVAKNTTNLPTYNKMLGYYVMASATAAAAKNLRIKRIHYESGK